MAALTTALLTQLIKPGDAFFRFKNAKHLEKD